MVFEWTRLRDPERQDRIRDRLAVGVHDKEIGVSEISDQILQSGSTGLRDTESNPDRK